MEYFRIICENCGEDFKQEAKGKPRRFCTSKCRERASYLKSLERAPKCPRCNGPWLTKSTTRLFCNKCYKASVTSNTGETIIRACSDCGGDTKQTRRRRCNPCMHEHNKKRALEMGILCECGKPATNAQKCGTCYSREYRANNPERRNSYRRLKRSDPVYDKTCPFCEAEFSTTDKRKTCCSRACASRHKAGWSNSKELMPYDPQHVGDILALQHLIADVAENSELKRRADLRSPIRKAYEQGDMPGLIQAIKDRSKITEAGCWEWQGQVSKEGYGHINFSRKRHAVHRLSAMAQYGQPESEPVVHHVCANRPCCNPDHLQPVSQRENTAEMLERNYYRTRIAELEAELMKLDPMNPKLSGYELSA